MTAQLFLRDLWAYSLQVGLVIAAGAVLPALVRLGSPRARLIYWQILLVAAAVALPLLEPWQAPPAPARSEVTAATRGAIMLGGAHRTWPSPRASWGLWLLVVGTVARAGWLALGFRRLAQHRRRSRSIEATPELRALSHRLRVRPDLYIGEVCGPVTFGWLRPVVIFPERFLALPECEQRAIASHEFLHVQRRDWLFTVAEEFLRCALWFHPAVWWLLGRIQLAREQAVDHATVALLADRERYLETLLDAAAQRSGLDLAPAPLFLKKRHLSQRVASLLKETPMSKRRLVSSLVTISGAAIFAMRLSVALFPLTAPAQELTLDPGITVDMGSYHLLHAAPIQYPPQARGRNLEGVVQLELTVDPTGAVTDARASGGQPELRRAAMVSALQWHFVPDPGLPSEIPVTVQFSLAPETSGSLPAGPLTVHQILFTNLSVAIKDRLLQEMPVRVGDSVNAESLEAIQGKLNAIDEHLVLSKALTRDGSLVLTIGLRGAHLTVPPAPLVEMTSSKRIRIGGNVQATMLVHKVTPKYPPLAKAARIQGKVSFNVIVAKDGTVESITWVSGDPLLAEAAEPALKQWVYKPTLLNGDPIEVATVVDVNFTLAK